MFFKFKKEAKYIAKFDWVSRWAGSYTFISPAYWGYQYNESLKKTLGLGFKHTLFIHRQGVVAFYVTKQELDALGNYLVKKISQDPALAQDWCNELKKNADNLTIVMNKLKNKIPSLEEYEVFLKYFANHLPYHVFVKKTVDYLPLEEFDKFLPIFKDARLYSESIYSDTESFFRSIAKIIGEKENYSAEYLTCLTQAELENYLKNKKLPKDKELAERYRASILYFEDNKLSILFEPNVSELENLLIEKTTKNTSELSGVVACKGKAIGICRIVLDPFKVGEFNEGDILVTGMTRPEFMPLIKKASAIITDVGGVLSHAAIVARELNKPCIVGTQVASKILKDGMNIEVDADRRKIKIIE